MVNGNGNTFVFLDTRGKRWPRLRLIMFIFAMVFLLCAILFVQSLFVTPQLRLPSSVLQLKARLKTFQKQDHPVSAKDMQHPWLKFSNGSRDKTKNSAARSLGPAVSAGRADSKQIRLGFYTNSDRKSYESLKGHAYQLTHVCPEWMSVVDGRGTLDITPDESVRRLAARSGVVLLPLLDNSIDDARIPEAVEGLADGPESRRERFIQNLVVDLEAAGAGGVVIDWEGMDPACRNGLTLLLREMAGALHKRSMELWMCVPMSEELKAFDLEALSGCVDHFVAMTLDEHSDSEPPGPVASQNWFEGWLKTMEGYGNPSQWIIAIGAYGYDWTDGEKRGDMISFSDAMSRAEHAGLGRCELEAPSFNPHFSYEDSGTKHTVWFLDAVTFLNQARVSSEHFSGGIAISRLGTEDPGIWKALPLLQSDALSPSQLAPLQKLKAGDAIAHIGKGDFLTVDGSTADGARTLNVDRLGRVIEHYKAFPTYLTVSHQGRGDKDEVAITFDDGPDPRWTPGILDILKAYGARATFFLVGSKAEAYPDLVQRIVGEGHEVGVHTYTHPNLAEVSDERARLELNATQRLIEVITGRSTILFRPPYNADSNPATLPEILPISLAQNLGYLTVASDIDPEDWSQPGANVIVKRAKRQRRLGGQIVLLHDAGGDRHETVEALPEIIDYLKTRGDRIVPLERMLGESREDVMPPIGKDQPVARLVSRSGFHVLYVLENFIWAFIIVATACIVLRTLFIAFLAFRNRQERRKRNQEAFHPPLSILIPAYNEGKVIESTLGDLLDTTYPGKIEIIVVDDGSADDTARVVAKVAARDSRVRLIRQANRGKAVALARGLEAVSHEILVTLDADTHFGRNTLEKLVAPLKDESVGAVSGHTKVGNLRTFIARCQSLEYACGFNLERRACHELNAITVVPGAVSALRVRAIFQAGGISMDTLAEDTDLTLSMHRQGFRVVYVPDAVAWTEAPETIKTLAKQRFRWSFGTLQCLWKHRDMVFNTKYKALGWFILPSVWFFHILLTAIGPMIDAVLIFSLFIGMAGNFYIYLWIFILMDFLLAVFALFMEREPLRNAWLTLPMRLIYRPLLSWVVWKSIFKAIKGVWVNWGKLERTASVAGRSAEFAPSSRGQERMS